MGNDHSAGNAGAQIGMEYLFKTSSADETGRLAAQLAAVLRPGDVLAMTGNLASGKTTFTQGLAAWFQVEEYALSPTFTYINEYHGPHQKLVHIDAYRLHSGQELIDMGIWEYYESGAIVIIEWADLVVEAIPADAISLAFKHLETEPDSREIFIRSPRPLDLQL